MQQSKDTYGEQGGNQKSDHQMPGFDFCAEAEFPDAGSKDLQSDEPQCAVSAA